MIAFVRHPLAVAAAAASLALGGCSRASLTLEPAVLPGCAAGHGAVVMVRWDARAIQTKFVQVALTRPGGGERGWTRGKPVGSRSTGRWAVDGLTFILRDDDGRELARETLETSRCPRKQKDE
ncbi:MAG: hypothetical protein ACJ8GK_00555 [Luteimonas sp.]